MVHFRRSLVPGGSFFFTVTLADRRSSALTEHITSLRHAFRTTRAERAFNIDAIRDERDLDRHVDYIHYNPIKHGLVTRVTDWPYSSFRRYVRQGWLPDDWAGTVEDSEIGFGERKR
jgi:REP element-mobilizing transposase RayT